MNRGWMFGDFEPELPGRVADDIPIPNTSDLKIPCHSPGRWSQWVEGSLLQLLLGDGYHIVLLGASLQPFGPFGSLL